jgi:hypothetical protein
METLTAFFSHLFSCDLTLLPCLLGVTLVNLTGFQWGINADETGINIRSFKCKIAPEFKEYLKGKSGAKRGFAVEVPELTISLEGEISGATGVMAAVTTTATTLANSSAYFGAPTTGKYLDSAEVTEGREGWKDLTAEFSAQAGIP